MGFEVQKKALQAVISPRKFNNIVHKKMLMLKIFYNPFVWKCIYVFN